MVLEGLFLVLYYFRLVLETCSYTSIVSENFEGSCRIGISSILV